MLVPTDLTQDNQYTMFIGDYSENAADSVYRRLVPGDIITRDIPGRGHVAIVNIVTGNRGESKRDSKYKRNIDDVWLIQAIANPKGDKPNPYNDIRLDGRVTDTWNWGVMYGPKDYHVRRLKP